MQERKNLRKVDFGKTGMQVTAMSFGALPMGRCSMQEADIMLNAVLDSGINFMDTARLYNDCEDKIGLFISKRRSEYYLATKTLARSAEGMYADILTSLEKMRTDYIDLYQMHNPKNMQELEIAMGSGGALEALKQAKSEGKIRHIGITGHNVDVLKTAIASGEFASVQVPYNFVEQQAEKELLPLARSLGMGILGMKPFGGSQIRQVDLSLRFILQQQDIVPIPGMDTPEQLRQNIDTFKNFQPLNAAEYRQLEQEAQEIGKDFCRRCGYCLPCAVGIDIPALFILNLTFKRYGAKAGGLPRYAAHPVKASACTGCGICEKRCPYDIKIRERMQEVVRNFES